MNMNSLTSSRVNSGRTMLSGAIQESRVVAELGCYREEVCTSYKFMQRTPHHTVVEAAIT
jgi:hypothetical protein